MDLNADVRDLEKLHDFLLKNDDLLLKNDDFIIIKKAGTSGRESAPAAAGRRHSAGLVRLHDRILHIHAGA